MAIEQFTEVKMAIERTFSIIKPNAVAKNVIGSTFEAAGFKIVGTKGKLSAPKCCT